MRDVEKGMSELSIAHEQMCDRRCLCGTAPDDDKERCWRYNVWEYVRSVDPSSEGPGLKRRGAIVDSDRAPGGGPIESNSDNEDTMNAIGARFRKVIC